MSSVNKVILVGRLGQDPEVKEVGDTSVANMSIATSESWKDKSSGERKERTEWTRVVAWGRQAEIAGKYLRKGSLVYVEGQLQTRKWQDNDGNDRYTTEVRISMLRMLGGRNDSNSSSQASEDSEPAAATAGAGSGGGNGTDDIPF